MTMQIILTALFLGLTTFSWLRMGKVRVFARLLTILCLVGIYFIWSPTTLTLVANALGIGRGADLLLYIFLIFVLFELLISRIRDKEREEMITKLARRVAIQNAKTHNEPH